MGISYGRWLTTGVGRRQAVQPNRSQDRKMNPRTHVLSGVVLLVWFGGGCVAPSPSAGRSTAGGPVASASAYSLRQLQGDPRAAFRAAASAMVAEGFEVSRRDAQSLVLRSAPLLGDPASEPLASRAKLGTRQPIRRIAEVRIDEAGTRIKVFCRVAVQERSTELHRIQATNLRSSDSPSATPIEREGTAGREHADVWRYLRRDKAAERRMLSAVESAVASDAG